MTELDRVIATIRKHTTTELGPNQLAWCRDNVPHFKRAECDVLLVRAEEAANRKAQENGETE